MADKDATKDARREDRILDTSFLSDVEAMGTPDLRSRRDECRELEAEFSYARRLLQGRLDILAAELKRRSGGGDPAVDDLVQRLPSILADEQSSRSATQRLIGSGLPANAGQFRREAERLAAEPAHIDKLSLPELAALVERLSGAERQVSEQRRTAQRIVDGLNAELVRRYRKGDEDPAALLRG